VKIYTRTGDRGETGLLDGSRVPKDDPRVAAYGEIDELNAVLGLVRAHARARDMHALLGQMQRDLFALGAQLADPAERVAKRKMKAAVTAAHVRRLERAIDVREAKMPPLRTFLLPGGSPAGAFLHLARTVCRRAERAVVTLGRAQKLDPRIVTYLNRVSDLLFVLARYENHTSGTPEEPW
jgi:cob(I)alamin adenosyltransferase